MCHKDVAGWLLICEIVNFYQLRRFFDNKGKVMELRHLRYFVAVAQALNFTRAAEKLHTSQPSLSSQIRDLENCVGVPLLVRDKRKVALTAAGECFLQDALAILEQAENAKLRARNIVQEDR
ncbi:transcriptional regulator, partial [Escherichia coli]